jgi:hypothetical protein
MVYAYRCLECKNYVEIVKHHSLVDEIEVCDCGGQLKLLLHAPAVSTPPQFNPQYFYAFGKHINSKYELKETLREIKGESGREILEVGNEKPKLKPKRKEYTLD